MTAPFIPGSNGVAGAAMPTFPMPPGQGTFPAPVPQQPATVIREGQWTGYPASAVPPMPQQPVPQQPGAPVQGQPQYTQPAPQYPAQPVQAGQQVPTQHPQPQTQPGQSYVPQTQQQPHAATNGIDPNTVLQGPAFPPELQGVTLGQAITMYGGMRNLVLGLQARQAQQVATPQQQPQQHPQQPSPLAGQQGQGQSAFDWRNPAPGIAAIVGQVLDERLAPMQQQSAIQAAGTVRATVAQEIGVQRFAQLEPAVMRYLAGASPQDLANPDLWRVAIRAAAGEAYLNGQQGQPQRQPAGQAYGGAVPFQPGMQNPAPPLQSFFTEAPQAGQPVQGVTLTPAQMWIADQMGISQADYAAYASGVPQRVPQNGGRV